MSSRAIVLVSRLVSSRRCVKTQHGIPQIDSGTRAATRSLNARAMLRPRLTSSFFKREKTKRDSFLGGCGEKRSTRSSSSRHEREREREKQTPLVVCPQERERFRTPALREKRRVDMVPARRTRLFAVLERISLGSRGRDFDERGEGCARVVVLVCFPSSNKTRRVRT